MNPILILAPESGAKLLLTDGPFTDQGSAYTFNVILRPVWAEGAWAQWQTFGLEVRHNSAVDLLVTPIVDGVELVAQQFALTAATPTGWARTVLMGRFQAWGQKATVKIETNTLPGQFHIEGAWFDVREQRKHSLA